MELLSVAVVAVLSFVLLLVWARMRALVRAEYIHQYTLPAGLLDKLKQHYPAQDPKDRQLIARSASVFFSVFEIRPQTAGDAIPSGRCALA